MKKILTLLLLISLAMASYGQVNMPYGFRVGVPLVLVTTNGLEFNILDGALVNTTELNRLVGVTSSIQTQLNAKAPSNNAIFTGVTNGITASMVGAMSTSHVANAITSTNISNWNVAATYNANGETAYTWGNHAAVGYLLKADSTSGASKYATDHRVDLIETDLADYAQIPSWSFTFNIGANNPNDTLAFTDSTMLSSYNGTMKAMHVDSVSVITMKGEGYDTLGVQFQWHRVFKHTSATKLWTVALPVGRPSSTTTGTLSTTFANAIIPAGVTYWITLPYIPADNLKRKPKGMSFRIFGHYN